MGENQEIKELYGQLVALIKGYHPSQDFSMIDKAYEVAKEAHKDQVRKSGEPYFIHPLNVAIILAKLKLDKETIAAAILHDVVEDTPVTAKDLEREFGHEVAFLVDGVTKLTKLQMRLGKDDVSKEEQKIESFRKLLMAMSEDIRVIIIKLADRLHNMRTMQFQKEDRQIAISRETMDIYCPIAKRLGISILQTELEDLAMQYIYPEAYSEIQKKIQETEEEREQFVHQITQEITMGLHEAGIDVNIIYSLKHMFSIYRKMINSQKTLNEMYDIYAIKILVPSIRDCYITLGVLHDLYKPIPGRFKDFIALTKSNMYQSLHTTLVAPGGEMFEVQIKTREMQEVATYGILARWKYGMPGKSVQTLSNSQKEKADWLSDIMEWQRDVSDNNKFLELVKQDFNLFSENIYCFSPKGESKILPKGVTAIDFAYAIHSDIGNHAVGCIINGREMNLESVLNNGDKVEIIVDVQKGAPNRDWINIVKTATAKNKIRKWFHEQ
jgi:GTP pyrophosphokinase